MSTGYAVVDVETTGVAAASGDRIVEIAIVSADERGVVEGSWSTLVNPRRPVSAVEVHGIRAGDLLAAPTFADLVPLVLESLAGRVLVAHNARFDVGFIEAELAAAGHTVEIPASVCTMEHSRHFLRGVSRKLADCCAAAGVPYEDRHTALADATAAAGLLAHYLSREAAPPWSAEVVGAQAHRWLQAPTGWARPTLLARELADRDGDPWATRVTSELPRLEPSLEAYVDVLDAAIVDGFLARYEREQLATLAMDLGIGAEQLDRVHRGYFSALCSAAWADGEITFDEQAQLTMIAAALTIPTSEAIAMLAATETSPAPVELAGIRLSPRDRIQFVAPLGTPAEEWAARVEALGLVVVDDPARARYVVTADPDHDALVDAWGSGANVITEWSFDTAVEYLEDQRRRRGLLL